MNLDGFLDKYMKQRQRLVAGRLQAALALLERLRDCPSLQLAEHLVGKGRAGLVSHETYGKRSHVRFELEPINKNHGRRSSNIQDWGQVLLDAFDAEGFADFDDDERASLILRAQEPVADALRRLLEQEPLVIRTRQKTAEAVIAEILKLADAKGKAGDVAQYLVGAKLMLRFDEAVPVLPANKGDRRSKSDPEPRLGDFEIQNAVIEVALGLPDEKHLDQIALALDDPQTEVRLLTRDDRVGTWRREIDSSDEIESRRVVVSSVSAFVGQNIGELSGFSSEKRSGQLKALFEIYNKRWNAALGNPGMAIVVK